LRRQIAIIGSAKLSFISDISSQIEELAKALVANDCIVLAGSCGGVGNLVARSVYLHGGCTIGISPCASSREHIDKYGDESNCFSSFIYCGNGFKGRNVVLVQSSDAVISICGQTGTLNELTIAYDSTRPIGLLKNTGGITDTIESIISNLKVDKKTPIINNQDPHKLVNDILQILSGTR